MLNLINQVRDNPENIWEYTNLTQVEVYEKDPDIPDLIYSEYKYKPLFFDASLSDSAKAHSFYTLNEMYQEEALSETHTALERAKYYKYEGEAVQEFAVGKYFLTEDDDRSVYKFFLSWIEKELEESPPCSAVIFSEDFQDVGSSIDFESRGGIYDYDISVLSFVVGKNEPITSNDESSSSDNDNDEKVRIYGVLFSDNDGDGLYAPGEELIQKTVIAYDDKMQEIETAVTDNAGHFVMTTLEPNRQYNFVPAIEENQVTWDWNDGNYFITSDQFVKLLYAPPSLENNLPTVDLQ
jgi:hypothetical protein